jgi:hypothetical protein
MSLRRKWDPPPPPPPASECVPPPGTKGGARPPAGEGVGESQFQRLEEKLITLSTLWKKLFFSAMSWPTVLPLCPPGSRPRPPCCPRVTASCPRSASMRSARRASWWPSWRPRPGRSARCSPTSTRYPASVTTRKKIVAGCDD